MNCVTAMTSTTMLPTYTLPTPPGKYGHSRSGFNVDKEPEPQPHNQTADTTDDLPQPLSIAKKETECERDGQEDDTPRARPKLQGTSRTVSRSPSHSSAGSECSDVSMDSLPEPLGGERSLTISKRRGNKPSRTSQIGDGTFRGVEHNIHKENGRQEQGMTDVMASLSRMTLSGQSALPPPLRSS